MPDEEVDMNRYYLRPGCTEPELRPEFAAEEAAKTAAADTTSQAAKGRKKPAPRNPPKKAKAANAPVSRKK